MTRREGTSKSNSLCARARFAETVDVAQIYFSHRIISIAPILPDRFGSKHVSLAQLLTENPLVTARSLGKFVFDKIR